MAVKQDKVTAVTVSFNCKEHVFTLLASLKKSKYKNFEIVVVDNGSTDGTVKEGKKRFSKVKWVDAGKKNIGWGGSYNLGFAKADKKSHILLIDSDVTAAETMLSRLVDRMSSSPKIGIVTPMILYLSDHKWVNQAGAVVNLTTGKVNVGWGPKKNFRKAKRVQNSGTVLLIKRDVVETIGGFDDWFTGYLDPDYCLRAFKAGFETWYEPGAVAYHDQSKDKEVWGPRIFNRAYLVGRNRTLFMRRHGNSLLVYLAFTPLLLGYYLTEAVKYGHYKSWWEMVKGTFSGFFYPLSSDLKIPLPKGS